MDWSHYVLRGQDDHSHRYSYYGGDVYHPSIFYSDSTSHSASVVHDHSISHSDGGGHSDGDYPQVHQRPERGSDGNRLVAANRR